MLPTCGQLRLISALSSSAVGQCLEVPALDALEHLGLSMEVRQASMLDPFPLSLKSLDLDLQDTSASEPGCHCRWVYASNSHPPAMPAECFFRAHAVHQVFCASEKLGQFLIAKIMLLNHH